MAGQDLFDESGAGPGQPDDEDRPPCLQPEPGGPPEEVRGERLDQPPHEPLVVLRTIDDSLCSPQLQGQCVGFSQAGCGAGIIAPSVEHVGQGEQESCPGLGAESRFGQQPFDDFQVLFRQPAPQ